MALSDQEHTVVATAAAAQRLALGAFAAQATLTAAQGSICAEYTVLREALAGGMDAARQAQRIGVNLNQAVAALNSGELRDELRWCSQVAARTLQRLDDLAAELQHRLP